MPQRPPRAYCLPLCHTLVAVAGLFSQAMRAQEEKPYTLHVYANLIQLPTLVLTPQLKPVPSLTREKFSISLDDGPAFHPTQMRIEGDDPIDFALLLDASGDQDGLFTDFAKSFAKLVPRYLHPKDRLSVFAVDCKLVRSFNGVPYTPDGVRDGIDAALHAPTLHGEKQHAACYDTLPLWDSVSRIANFLADQQGRRVILIVSDGHDGGSKRNLSDAANYAGSLGVGIFAMRRGPDASDYSRSGGTRSKDISSPALDLLTQANGGISQVVPLGELPSHLQDLFDMLRSRYILEFPRPDRGEAGLHSLVVKVPGLGTVVRPTGFATPLPDPTLADDPTVVHSAPSPATIGSHRPPQPQP